MKAKQGLISSVLTLMFSQAGVTDNIDLMRCNILAMNIERLFTEGNLSMKSVKATSSFASVLHDVGCPDEFLQKLIDKANSFELVKQSKVAQLVDAGFVITEIWTNFNGTINLINQIDDVTIEVAYPVGKLMFYLTAPSIWTIGDVKNIMS